MYRVRALRARPTYLLGARITVNNGHRALLADPPAVESAEARNRGIPDFFFYSSFSPPRAAILVATRETSRCLRDGEARSIAAS